MSIAQSKRNDRFGILIFSEDGSPLLEVGAHIVQKSPKFAEMIGSIAAAWAQAEADLYCFFSVLLDKTPDEAANYLKNYRTAKRATDGARKLAKERLTGAELEAINLALDHLDQTRDRRNRVLHDIWAQKGADRDTLFTVHAKQYTDLHTRTIFLMKTEPYQEDQSQKAIELAKDFAENISNGYSIDDLDGILQDLNLAIAGLIKLTFSRAAQP